MHTKECDLAPAAARLSWRRKQGTGVGPRENGDLIRPTEALSRPGPSGQTLSVRVTD